MHVHAQVLRCTPMLALKYYVEDVRLLLLDERSTLIQLCHLCRWPACAALQLQRCLAVNAQWPRSLSPKTSPMVQRDKAVMAQRAYRADQLEIAKTRCAYITSSACH